MSRSTQGEILRAWRERKGLSLEAAALGVEMAARDAGVDLKSKRVPRTHASLSRWETGVVEVKELGLRLIADAYGVELDDLRRPPPPENAPPMRRIEVEEEDAPAVEAFLETLKKRRAKSR